MTIPLPHSLCAWHLVPVVVLDEASAADPLAEALVAGGLPVAEITFRTSAALEAIRRMAARKDVAVGAGTVLTPGQVDEAVDAGASFIVSPGLSEEVILRAERRRVPVIPGAVTASEVQRAYALGLRTVKFFPAATAGGAAAIAALSKPFGDMRFLPTGGIGPDNLADYLTLSSVAAVGGSWMVPRHTIAAGDFQTIRRLVDTAAAQAAAITGGLA
jgi:2-dehydro-3-deoxyphosphogluconate aldolase/(4S)-4-hydroxy-2-oxoglutarate aldolase